MVSLKSKILVCGMSVLCASLVFAPQAFAKELKIGVVDVEHIYASYQKAQVSANQFQGERKQKQEDYNKQAKELKSLVDQYNKNRKSLSKTEREKALKNIEEQTKALNDYKNKTDAELIKENKKITQARLKEISAAIQTYAKDNGYDLIIDKQSLPYFTGGLNISDRIISILNKQ